MLTIYVIYHTVREDLNIFTTHKNKISLLLKIQKEKYEGIEGDWEWREIQEESEFDADMTGW
jgi:hypothetical protein